jgi:hypothetical protein
MGSVEGVVFGDLDAFADASNVDEGSLDQPYVDGVSVTTSSQQGARQHVFTFASGHPLDQDVARCPCAGGNPAPTFISDDFFCDKPSTAARAGGGRFFDPSTPQWNDTMICEPADQEGAALPFFVRPLFFQQATLRDLEVRIMADQASSDEDIAITHLELYIRE